MNTTPRISLRVVLIGINLTVLILPLAGIQLMRIYESALVRQTESALIAQAAFIAAFYRAQVIDQGTQNWLQISREIDNDQLKVQEDGWLPRPPELDLTSSPLLPPFPDAKRSAEPNDYAARAGARLQPVLKDAQLTTLAGIRVTDPWGSIIASTGDDVGLSIAHGPEVALALNGESASRIRQKVDGSEPTTIDSLSRNSNVRVFVSSPIVLHGRLIGSVMLSRTPPSILQALYAKRWLLLQGFGLLIALVVIMSLMTFRLIARPIGRLSEQAQKISSGEISAHTTLASPESRKPRTREIAQLQEAITEMAQTLEHRANYLQDFARHVSHEFKTPIASIRAAIEVLQDHSASMDAEQTERFMRNIEADADRLHRLTQRLLELSRAELRVSADVPAHNLLETVQEALVGFDQADVVLTGIDGRLDVRIEPATLQAAIETLIENAVEHGATQVVLSTPDGHTLSIADNGRGISPNNQDLIFTPFFTTRRDEGGTGLGLSIARALLQTSRATLSLNSNMQPTRFDIGFTQA
ncbi:MAG: ATP-binding protein [Pseudomonadota bacterium]